MVDIAKSLGQVYKTQQDKLDEQLKGKNLQEQISIKLEQSEQKIEVLAASRIKSFINIQDLQNEIQTTSAKIEAAYAQNPYDEKAIAEHNTLNEKIAQLSLEKHLLSVSGSQLASLKLRNNLLKIGNNLVIGFNKTLEMSVKLSESLMTKLNMPTTIVGTFTKILDIFNEIDTAATNVRQKF
jgi:hypothetical protein